MHGADLIFKDTKKRAASPLFFKKWFPKKKTDQSRQSEHRQNLQAYSIND
jgi:hypothetical protein